MNRHTFPFRLIIPIFLVAFTGVHCASDGADTEPGINGIPQSANDDAHDHVQPQSVEEILSLPHLGFVTGRIASVEPVLDVWAPHGGVPHDERTLETITCSTDIVPALRFTITDARTTWVRDETQEFTFHVQGRSAELWTTTPFLRANSHSLEWRAPEGETPIYPQSGLEVGVFIAKYRNGEFRASGQMILAVDEEGWMHDVPYNLATPDGSHSLLTNDVFEIASRIPEAAVLDTSSLGNIGRTASHCPDLARPQEELDEQNRVPSDDLIGEEPVGP